MINVIEWTSFPYLYNLFIILKGIADCMTW